MLKTAIVICTHNRHETLAAVLKSALKSSYKNKVIAVIDSSDRRAEKSIQKLADIYIYAAGMKALSLKRNLAIQKINVGIIAFTDDDCIITKDWLATLVSEFSDSSVACVTGRTVAFKGSENTLYEKKFSFDRLGRARKIIQKHFGLQNLWRFGHGNNMAFRKSVFERIGLFDEALGVGSKGLAGEDVDMFYRIYKAGFNLVYNPAAIIYHKHLTKDADMLKMAYRNGYASYLILKKNLDLNCISIFLGGIAKFIFKIAANIIRGRMWDAEFNINLLKGWLGLREV